MTNALNLTLDSCIEHHRASATTRHHGAIRSFHIGTIDLRELEITMVENIPRRVVTTRTVKGWLANLTDQVGKAAIIDRIDALKQGNFGDIDSINSEPGLFEMRISVGPGYRVYFGEFDGPVVVLILRGPKKTQKSDIKKAGAALRWLQIKAKEEKAAKAAQYTANNAGKAKSKRK